MMVAHSSVSVEVVPWSWCKDLPAVSYSLHAAKVSRWFSSMCICESSGGIRASKWMCYFYLEWT